MIRNIEVSKLVPHPQNPRKDLGDLTELVDSCKDDDSIWKNKALVKAKNAFQAWEKFREKWIKELEQGKADIPLSSISEYSVEVVCSVDDVMF